MNETQQRSDVEAVDALARSFNDLKAEIGKVIIGQEDVVKTVIISLFANGHSLLVGVPGLAKTLLVSTISEVLDLDFKRIQFTPDLMPSDIMGLEAMQERSVTVAGTRHKLEQPFFVLATQNPIEQEGTYPLPEAQLDRFMFNIPLDYPSYEEELQVVKSTTAGEKKNLNNILTGEQIMKYQDLVRKIPIADNVLEYGVALASKTRPNTTLATDAVNNYISWGAGPRASQYLILGAKTHAAIQGKYSPDIEDIHAIANYVLRHRVVRNYKAEAEGVSIEDIISGLL